MTSLYDILEVSPKACDAVIRAAYRCLAQKYHPDRNLGDPAAGQRLSMINHAYAVLADPLSRALYDQQARISGSDRRGSERSLAPARKPSAAAPMRPFVFRKFA